MMTPEQLLDEFDRLPWRDRDRIFRLIFDRHLGTKSGAERYLGIDEAFARYHKAMFDITGEDCTERTRRPAVVWARNIVTFQMLQDGYPGTQIARRLGLDHSTISHCRDSVKQMIEEPRFYPQEMATYKKFKKAIR